MSLKSARWQSVEWPTFLAIVLCYLGWLAAGALVCARYRVLGCVLLALVVAFHSSLQHEATHRHPTRLDWLNEILVGLPIGVFYPFRRYRETHLLHHRDGTLTDPHDDPESYYLDPARAATLPVFQRWLLTANNTLLGRILLGPGIACVRFALGDLRRIVAGDRAVRRAWLIHGLSLVPVVVVVQTVFGMPFWLYVSGPVYGGMALIAIRSFCEHQSHREASGRTVIVEGSWLGFLFLHNNLHVVHHARPGLPWYRLPAAYRAERGHWTTVNGGYVFRGYRAIARQYLLRRKEPLAHPFREGA